MARDVLLAAWKALPEQEQRSIVAALQKLADAEGEAEKESVWRDLLRKPLVDLFSSRADGDTLIVYYFYEFRAGHQPQSGSDWDDHHFHVGEAVCRKGRVESTKVKKDVFVIPEYHHSIYDEEAEVKKRRAAAVEDHWNQWWSLPFPFPE